MAKKGSASTDKKAADKSDKKGKAKATTDDGEEKQAKVSYPLVLCVHPNSSSTSSRERVP
jgi:hypothetical protein